MIRGRNFNILIVLLIAITGVSTHTTAEESMALKDKTTALYNEYKNDLADVTEFLPETGITSAHGKSILYVDVREPKEIDVSMLPGAISKAVFLKQPEKFKDKTIVAYCTIGYRSGLFAREMKKKGVDVQNLAAGILGWIHAGGTVYDSRGPVKRVHVYGEKWNCAPEEYETVTFGLLEKIFD